MAGRHPGAAGGGPPRASPSWTGPSGCWRRSSPAHRSLSLTSLSARAGLPKPSALRIARRLVEWGALERGGDGRYVVGVRLLEVASLAPRGHGLRATALPYLEDLHQATGQHVLLAVRDGLEAILVERLSAHGAGQVLYRVGGRMPLHATGVGLVLLACAPAPVQDEVLAGDLTAASPSTPQLSGRDLRAQLAAIRRDGVAVASRHHPEAMTSVAAADHRTSGRGPSRRCRSSPGPSRLEPAAAPPGGGRRGPGGVPRRARLADGCPGLSRNETLSRRWPPGLDKQG